MALKRGTRGAAKAAEPADGSDADVEDIAESSGDSEEDGELFVRGDSVAEDALESESDVESSGDEGTGLAGARAPLHAQPPGAQPPPGIAGTT